MNEHKRLMHRDTAKARRVDTRSLSAVSAVVRPAGVRPAPGDVGEGQLPPVSVAATTIERGSAVLNLEARQRAEWGGGIRKVADASCGRNPTTARFLGAAGRPKWPSCPRSPCLISPNQLLAPNSGTHVSRIGSSGFSLTFPDRI